MNLDNFSLYLRAFLVNCGRKSFFSNKLRPMDYFFFGMWPSDKFEADTPDLNIISLHQNITNQLTKTAINLIQLFQINYSTHLI
jgi:hypothetical protein